MPWCVALCGSTVGRSAASALRLRRLSLLRHVTKHDARQWSGCGLCIMLMETSGDMNDWHTGLHSSAWCGSINQSPASSLIGPLISPAVHSQPTTYNEYLRRCDFIHMAQDMLDRLRTLPWRRVDVCFKGTSTPFMAHNHIQVGWYTPSVLL